MNLTTTKKYALAVLEAKGKLTALKKQERALYLAVLLLESGTAKKLLNKQELSALKKALKQMDSDFKTYIKKVKKRFQAGKAVILASIASSASR